MHAMLLFAVIILSAMQGMNCDWVATNISHFCAIANDCIITKTESVTIVDNNLRGNEAVQACRVHRSYCDPSSSDTRLSRFGVSIHDDKDQFCHLILSCYESGLIIGPVVDVAKWCPYAKFCNQQIKNNNIRYSCCVHCSCEPTCGHTNDCCYSHNASYNAIESEELKCISLTTAAYKSVGFYMRDTCMDGSTCLYSHEQTTPASSQEKQRIYISKECGHCNNASDVIEWEVLTLCSDVLHCVDPVIQLPEQVDSLLIENYICSSNIIQTCDPRYRTVSVIQLCHTVNAKVFIRERSTTLIFANIFCVACNFYLHYNPAHPCVRGTTPTSTGTGFIMLLDTNLDRLASIKDPQHSPGKTDKCPAYMLNNLEQPGCRRVFCPTGMVRVKDGSCHYLGKIWHSVSAILQVRLLPLQDTTVPASILRSISNTSNINNWMRAPCLFWEDEDTEYGVAMLTSGVSQEEMVVEIVVQIQGAKADIKPTKVIPGWAACFDHSWTLIIGSKKYDFLPSIYPHKWIRVDDSWRISDESLEQTTYETIYRDIIDINGIAKIVLLSKLFFCDQVELSLEEYENTNDQIIRVLHNNITLGNSEFSKDVDTIRICIDNYAPPPMRDSANAVEELCLIVLVTCLWLTHLVHY